MFDNLKKRGSITRNAPEKDDKPRRGWIPGTDSTYCQSCNKERASGSIKMSDGTWKKVGPSCKRAMGVTKNTPRDQVGHTGTHSPTRKPYQTKGSRKPLVVESKREDRS